MPAVPGLSAIRDAFGAAFRATPEVHTGVPVVPAADGDRVLSTLAEPGRVVAEQAGDAAVMYAPTAAQKVTEPDRTPDPADSDADPLEPGRQPPGDPWGPDDAPHWTVSPFAPEAPLDGDPVDLDTAADLADVAGIGDIGDVADLPGLPDAAGLGDVV